MGEIEDEDAQVSGADLESIKQRVGELSERISQVEAALDSLRREISEIEDQWKSGSLNSLEDRGRPEQRGDGDKSSPG
jgi:uncharacterized protein YlxW (UPF0749 family)